MCCLEVFACGTTCDFSFTKNSNKSNTKMTAATKINILKEKTYKTQNKNNSFSKKTEKQ